jgi:aminoglycoside 6'-N-acetyltransferase I
MRDALWPDHESKWHAGEIEQFFAGRLKMPLAVLVAVEPDGDVVGFAELSIRNYAEGAVTDRVAFLEGWYVEERARLRGVGRALMYVAEDWGRAQGCVEFGSDALIDNEVSAKAHMSLGFVEVERIRCFLKTLS